MMPLLEGRIDRKTFIMGSAVGLGILLAVIIMFIIPIGLIDIVVNQSHSVNFRPVYFIFAIPAIVYAFYFGVLAIKRAHDIGLPGVPLLIIVGIAEFISRLTGWWIPHLLALLLLLLLVIYPSHKGSNKFGPRPHKRFRIANLRLNS